MSIRVIVAGANGKMGREAVKMITQSDHMSLVSAISRSQEGQDVGEVLGLKSLDISFERSLMDALAKHEADVLVDFTTPYVVKDHMELAIQSGVRPVVGTSGLTEEDLEEIRILCDQHKVGTIVAPNFAIGAVMMMDFAMKAAKYLPHVEIIESHHDQKLDAPSGTAMKTAEMIAQQRPEFRQGHPEETERLEGARGAYTQGFRIHSVRLPGLVAHQEVLFGGSGQLLTIRHDSFNRESFMPGVQLAIEKVMDIDHLIFGLEHILDI
ncbi:4-hydroxy-tetrahydrodipicolinate reductase [Hazenella coriacea]|uniref:4-hydroxy-tetrahydrodipicolinate reductase n=1 Tax=Hazenella coriacea TaxID=1179467 RepID=A0A4R3L391_9BACL|nr:4-hydroxy-tetrahydrodipicolinate reductase [Hazenella coriacea]TCS93368.1 dihydrodipicolinate reductase [Hazenella coriacea]